MFCSKCGKTLLMDAQICPSCGHPVGESRFAGSPYTSAQAHIQPGSGAQAPVTQAYTRTNYTSMGDAPMEGDTDTLTTYRPVYEGASAPEDIRRDMREMVYGSEETEAPAEEEQPAAPAPELSEEARQTIDAMDEQLKMESVDMSKFRARPIKSAGQTGISSDVSEFIQKLEADQAKKPASRRRREAYDVYEEEQPAPAADPENETTDESIEYDEQPDVFDDIDEEEFEELRHSGFGLKDILKVAVALVVVAALFVGGVMWFRYIRGNQSSAPIENVREDLYVQGLTMVKAHAEEDAVSSMLQRYKTSSSIATLTVELQTNSNALKALLPAEATDNEKLYLDALQAIESNIANCVMADAMAISQSDAEAAAASDDRWKVVTDSIAMLEASRSAAELTKIINGEQVDIPDPKVEVTPTPTPAVNYNTLAKGAKSDEVLDMQIRLYQLGFFLEDRDGDFGGKTQTAVKMFQEAAGLEITGIADNETLTAIYSDDAPRTQYAQATPTPAPTATPAPTSNPVITTP